MNGQKLEIINNGNSKITIKYQNFNDSSWKTGVVLNPKQSKTIWCFKGTFSHTLGKLRIISNVNWPETKIVSGPICVLPNNLTPIDILKSITLENPSEVITFDLNVEPICYWLNLQNSPSYSNRNEKITYYSNYSYDSQQLIIYNENNGCIASNGYYMSNNLLSVQKGVITVVDTGNICQFPTPTPTSSLTPTITPTPSITPTKTITPTITSTPTVTPTTGLEHYLRLTFDNIGNINSLVGDPSDVANWNNFFDLPNYGNDFSSVTINDVNVLLFGGSDIMIKSGLFNNNNSLIEIVDELNCITQIGISGFSSCLNLTTIILPNNQYCNTNCFNITPKVNYVSLPNLTTAGRLSFGGEIILTNLSLPKLTNSGEYCFYSCNNIANFNLPNLISIGNNGFDNCTSMTELYIPSILSLGDSVDNENVFNGITGKTINLTVSSYIMTCNDGYPDGDIQYLLSNNNVTIITINITPTPTKAPTPTPTPTNTQTPTVTPTNTPTNTRTPGLSSTPTNTPTKTTTNTPTNTPTNTVTPTNTLTPTNTVTPTNTTTSLSPTGSVCVSGAGSVGANGTYTYFQTVTVNGFTRPTYEFGLFLITPTTITGTTYWSIYNSDDERTYYIGNTTPLPQYPYQETSWRIEALGVLPLPTVNSSACTGPTPTPTITPTFSPTPTITPTNTLTPTPTKTPTKTPTNTPTNTPTKTQTPTITPTNTQTPTKTPTNTPTPTKTPGIVYSSVTIGSQIWETKNLDVSTYRDGTVIPQVTDPTEWSELTVGAWCYYNNDSTTGATYGKLYNWYAVAGIDGSGIPRNLAPVGWHVPSNDEWFTLVNRFCSTDDYGCESPLSTYNNYEPAAGYSLKESGTTHWYGVNIANNFSKFTALPGGFRDYYGEFDRIGISGYWRTLDYSSPGTIIYMNNGDISVSYDLSEYNEGYSVRLIKDY